MNNKISVQEWTSPVGELLLGSFEGKLCVCDWKYRRMREGIDKRITKGLNAEYEEKETEVISEAKKELSEYFSGQRREFTIPLLFVGTDFQKQVWEALMKIPFGKTQSYKGLSVLMQKPDAVRAVATANGANAISILVPCHRIIGAGGDLVGYAGGLPAKKKLLELEKSANPSLFDN